MFLDLSHFCDTPSCPGPEIFASHYVSLIVVFEDVSVLAEEVVRSYVVYALHVYFRCPVGVPVALPFSAFYLLVRILGCCYSSEWSFVGATTLVAAIDALRVSLGTLVGAAGGTKVLERVV
jgi:hypothetical protein